MNFYEFSIPAQFDVVALQAHIGCEEPYTSGDKLVIPSATLTLDQVTALMASYIYVAPTPPTPLQKLADAGLTVADLKTALGLP